MTGVTHFRNSHFARARRAALALAITAMASPGVAAFESLDETELSGITGQAGITVVNAGDAGLNLTGTPSSGTESGITIELAAQLGIGQIRYVDGAPLDINNFSLSGHNGTMLDNMKITIDVAGDNEVLDYGFSELGQRGATGVLDPANADVADAMTHYNVAGEYGKQFNDGDLVMHLTPTDSGDPASLTDYLYAIDFELGIDSIVTGGNPDSTSLFTDIFLQGYLGPTDIVVRNAAPGTYRTLSNGNQVSGSELQINSHFLIEDGHLDWDVADVILIFNLAAVGIEGLEIHNRRGDDTLGHFGMASVNANLSAGTGAISGVDGLSIHDVEFRADIDMPVFRIGNESIGGVYFSDFAITDTSMLVYGH